MLVFSLSLSCVLVKATPGGGSLNACGVKIYFKLDTSPTHCANIILITLCFCLLIVRVYTIFRNYTAKQMLSFGVSVVFKI
jgi:hypothetical protein